MNGCLQLYIVTKVMLQYQGTPIRYPTDPYPIIYEWNRGYVCIRISDLRLYLKNSRGN